MPKRATVTHKAKTSETPGHMLVTRIMEHTYDQRRHLRMVRETVREIAAHIHSYADAVDRHGAGFNPAEWNSGYTFADLASMITNEILWMTPNLRINLIAQYAHRYEMTREREQVTREAFAQYTGDDREKAQERLTTFDAQQEEDNVRT